MISALNGITIKVTILLVVLSVLIGGVYTAGYNKCQREHEKESNEILRTYDERDDYDNFQAIMTQHKIYELTHKNNIKPSEMQHAKENTCDFINNDFVKLYNKVHQ